MSGHSKWSTIKRKKGVNDAKRGKLFAKLIRSIEVAVKEGGTDPASNPSLNQAINKAKSNSVPSENIQRAIKRSDGVDNLSNYSEIYYEGYGPFGVAFYLTCVTDNKNRASSDVRSTFTKFKGSLGNPGSVSYLFERRGMFEVTGESDIITDYCIENGCLEIKEQVDSIIVEVNPKQYTKFKEWFESHEIKILSSDIPFLPKEHVIINSKQFDTIGNLIEALEELEDVHDVYTNFDISEKEFQSILK